MRQSTSTRMPSDTAPMDAFSANDFEEFQDFEDFKRDWKNCDPNASFMNCLDERQNSDRTRMDSSATMVASAKLTTEKCTFSFVVSQCF